MYLNLTTDHAERHTRVSKWTGFAERMISRTF